MGRHHEKLMPLLALVYRDDLHDDRDNAIFFIASCVDYMKHKMLSLSQHKEVLLNPRDGAPPVGGETVAFGNYRVPKEYLQHQVERPQMMEEFNRKVFELIGVARDERRLAQMPSNWNAWF